jgi:hypothetical protein
MKLAVGLSCLLAACSFSPPGDLESTVTLTDDSTVDFAAHDQLVDGVVTPWGTIEPDAFVLAGLHARAFDGELVDDDDSYDDVVQKATSPHGESYRQAFADWGNELRPTGLGLTSSDQFTVFYDGEIELPLGIQELELEVDDRAIVQLATDGKTFGERLFAHNSTASIPLDIRRGGWFPIRIAYSQGGGAAKLLLTTVQGVIRTPVDASSLRVRVTDHPGLVAFGFDSQSLLDARGETAVPTIDPSFGFAAPPYDLDLGFDNFSLRHAGQLRIDTQGMYTFRAEADGDDQYRMWIDGELVVNAWNGAPATPSATLDLAPGWHDFVVDYADNIGEAKLRVLMSGPGLAEATIDPAHLRPAVASGLVAQFAHGGDTTIDDDAVTLQDLTMDGPELAVLEGVDYGFGIKNHRLTDLTAELIDCSATKPLAISSSNVFVPTYFYFSGDTSCAGMPLDPVTPWRFRFTDSMPGNDNLPGPAYFDPILVASYHGGTRMPFARGVSFVSTPRATPGALRFTAIRVTGATDGGRIEIGIRSAADLDQLASAPWQVVENGSAPQLPANEFVQYQLALSSDGWQYPVVDRVELEYVTAQ